MIKKMMVGVVFLSWTLSFQVFAFSGKIPTEVDKQKGPEQVQRQQWITDWKEIKKVSFQDRKAACERFQKLPWISQFPHQDLIEYRRKDYCRTPPEVNLQNFDSLMISARYYREDFNYKRALYFLNRAFKKARTSDQKIQSLEEQLKIHRSAQNKKMRTETIRKMALIDSEKYTVDYARTLWTYNQIKKAQAELRKADKKWKKGVSRQGVYYIQGRILEEQGKSDEALKYYEKAVLEPDVDSEMASNVLSSLAWWQFKKGNYTRSAELFKQLHEKSEERFTQSRALYWRAQSLLKGTEDQHKEARKLLEGLLKEDPLSYYSVLAHRDLKKKFSQLKAFKGPARELKSISWVKETDADKFHWALEFEEKTFIDSVLQPYISKFHEARSQEQRIFVENYWRAGLTTSLIRLLASSTPEKRVEYFEDHQSLLFPSSYEKVVQKFAAEEKVDPSFVLSLIRQESGFNPMARSVTDALGLMQLMPKLARQIALEKGLNFKEETELFHPELNIQLGVRELKTRLQEFGGSVILAAASYNAGSQAVKGWLKTRYRPNIIEFIEEIPYEETRSYVRLILRNHIFYKRMLETKPFLFPEETLLLMSPDSK